MRSTPVHRSHRLPAAFSLLELLVAIAILAVVAALAIVGVQRSRETAANTRCLNNLREIGIATAAYTSEHGGKLPGPANSALVTFTSPALHRDPALLIDYLVSYLGVTLTAGENTIVAPFVCPSGQKVYRTTGAPETFVRYYLCPATYFSGKPPVRPFGYATDRVAPLRLSSIESPARTISTMDVDNTFMQKVNSTSAWYADTPAHGKKRNVLFLDGHVEALQDTNLRWYNGAIEIR